MEHDFLDGLSTVVGGAMGEYVAGPAGASIGSQVAPQFVDSVFQFGEDLVNAGQSLATGDIGRGIASLGEAAIEPLKFTVESIRSLFK